MEKRSVILAYNSIKDPRDMAEILHLAAGFGAEVHLLGKSLKPSHWKVLRKLRSWRPIFSEKPEEIPARSFPDARVWIRDAQARGFMVVATVLEGGIRPRLDASCKRIAILFGEETHGLPADLIGECNGRWTLPLGAGGRFYTLGQTTAVILGAVGL